MEPNERDSEHLVKSLVKAHNQALDYFRRGAAAAKKAGEYLHALMKIRDFKTREAVWRFVLDSSDLTEETFSYRTCASYMKIAADWGWMEALLGDELYSMTQNGFLSEAAKLNAKNRRRQEDAAKPPEDGESDEDATGDDGDTTPSEDEGDEDEAGDTAKPRRRKGGSGNAETGERTLDPVVVLTTLCNSLNEIVEAEIKEEELPEIETLIEKALSLIEALKKRCLKK